MEVYRVIEVTRGFDGDLSFRERSDEDLLLYRRGPSSLRSSG